MGNYSYIEEQEGCIIDVDKLKVLCKLNGYGEYIDCNGESGTKLESDNLGEYMNGWKIQGYWYDEFVKFLYNCADCMEGLTDSKNDNFIQMKEEQGFRFYIHFFKENDKPVVEVDYVPMEWETMILKREE